VVRITPNKLSFTTARSYQDIYGHTSRNKKSFLKTDFFEQDDVSHPGIVAVRDPAEHSEQRRMLANGFSTKALRDQEDVIKRYVDLFTAHLGKAGNKEGPGINMTGAGVYNWITFDIIGKNLYSIPELVTIEIHPGDLAFGESFDAIKQEQTPYWISCFFEGLNLAFMRHIVTWLPIFKLYLPSIISKDAVMKLKSHRELTREKTCKRIALQDSMNREDFFAQILRKRKDIPEDELISQAETLVVAGSDTTSTLLSGLTFYLWKNPAVQTRLTEEVRTGIRISRRYYWSFNERATIS
jgi:cytochrome P450